MGLFVRLVLGGRLVVTTIWMRSPARIPCLQMELQQGGGVLSWGGAIPSWKLAVLWTKPQEGDGPSGGPPHQLPGAFIFSHPVRSGGGAAV